MLVLNISDKSPINYDFNLLLDNRYNVQQQKILDQGVEIFLVLETSYLAMITISIKLCSRMYTLQSFSCTTLFKVFSLFIKMHVLCLHYMSKMSSNLIFMDHRHISWNLLLREWGCCRETNYVARHTSLYFSLLNH